MKKVMVSEGIGEESYYVISEGERIEISNRCFNARLILRKLCKYLDKIDHSKDYKLESVLIDAEQMIGRLDELVDKLRF